jgi:acetoin utilization deacetylase AcuC-like enzyme/ribosomal protein S18 acetylase RimI-like enzyme
MFRISHIIGVHRQHDRRCLEEIRELFEAAFPDYASDPEYIPRKLNEQAARGIPAILLAAHGDGDRVIGFALADYFASIDYAYLDFIVTGAERRGRGQGGALYEALREDMIARGAKGLFFEVPTDDPKQVAGSAILRANKARLRFYERYGARPVMGTLYDQPIRPGNPPEPRLLYDSLYATAPLRGSQLRKVIRLILTHRYNYAEDDSYVKRVVRSVADGPVAIRPPLYLHAAEPPKVPKRLHPLKVFCSARHSLHHIRERGYVERPARVDVILKAISSLPDVERLPVRNFGEGPIRAVHDVDFVNYLKNICSELPPGELLYPYVFPIRRTDRPPYDRSVRAGYYCIDTFTPLSLDAYKAARAAVNVALSGAQAILDGEPLVYSLCRPPGHHAERDTYGGFCYFCNGAIAAQYLATKLGGKIAVLDVDYHHGNGTQDIFYARNDILTVSIHGHPNFAYPYFSGFSDEKGEGEGLGFNHNLPLAEDCHDGRYLEALDEALSIVRRFKPVALVVSLGLDIAKADPTGTWSITPDGLSEVGRRIGSLRYPTLLVQEGGYNIRFLGRNAARLLTGVCAGALGRKTSGR